MTYHVKRQVESRKGIKKVYKKELAACEEVSGMKSIVQIHNAHSSK